MCYKRGLFSADAWNLVCLMANSVISWSTFLSCFFVCLFFTKGTQSETHEAHLLEDVIDRFQVSPPDLRRPPPPPIKCQRRYKLHGRLIAEFTNNRDKHK